MITVNAYLLDLQDLYKEVRAARRAGEDVPVVTKNYKLLFVTDFKVTYHDFDNRTL
jgi:hypothetical protein